MSYVQLLETIISIMLALPFVLNTVTVIAKAAGFPTVAYWSMRITPAAVAVAQAPRERMLETAAKGLVDLVKESPLPESEPASIAAQKLEAIVASDATKSPTLPPGAASLLLMLVLGGAAGGCGSPLATAVHVADAGAAAADAAKPVLEQSCAEPMARAARLHDNDLALAVAAKCDAPMIAYEALRIAHVALRGAILEVYAGRAVEGALLLQVPAVAAAGARLAAAVQKLATGTVTQ